MQASPSVYKLHYSLLCIYSQQTWKKDFVLELTPEHFEIIHHEVCSTGMAQSNYLAIHSSSSFCHGSSQCHALRGTFGKVHG